MSWRGGYQQRFVAASSSRGSSSNQSSSMNSVPPPLELTVPNAAAVAAGARPVYGAPTSTVSSSAQQRTLDDQRRKEEEYMSLVSGDKKIERERRKRLYDDEYLECDDDDDEEETSKRSSRDHDSSRDRDRSRSDRSSDRYRGRDKERDRRDDHKKQPVKKEESDDEDDPLDAFMAGVDQQAKKEKAESIAKDFQRREGKDTVGDDKEKSGLGRTDIDDEDMQESYFKFLEEKKAAATEEEDLYEYDEDGNIIWTWKKVIDPLEALDHSKVNYAPFNSNFYKEHEDITKLTHIEMVRLRERLGIKVAGFLIPRPVASFAHLGFDEALMKEIRKSEYEHPTSIQAQSIPAALSGRDVLGIAKTGSGKTAAYLWPAIVHIMDQPDLQEGDGPIALVVVPTRELAIQVYTEAKRFCRAYNINVICAYGGGSKWEQSNELQNEGAEMVICTPGRIIDLVKTGATNFTRVTFLVFDEADRMFDMGFEAQVKSISDHIRPDRQCLMFSATFKNKVEKLARDALRDPVRIVQGEVGEANEDIEQHVEVLPSQEAKWRWLTDRLVQFVAAGKVLIFVTKKTNSEDVAKRLAQRDFRLVLLHGDMQQHERNEHLTTFRKGCQLMIATDVAARGLDIPEIRTVISYDIARDIDTHVHRIGRTGRAGTKGDAYTLMTEADKEMAGHYVRNLESVNQQVPKPLLDLALKAAWFKASRRGDGTSGGNGPRERFGLGYKPKTRPVGKAGGAKHHDPLTANLSKPPGAGGGGVGGGGASVAGSSAGPAGSSRLSIMKNSFKASFQASFRPSSEALPTSSVSDPRPEWKKRIDELNAKLQMQGHGPPQGGSDESSGASSTKKSRWEK